MFARTFWSLAAVTLTLGLGAALDARAHGGSVVDGVFLERTGDRNPDEGEIQRAIKSHVIHADDGHQVPVDLSQADLPVGGLQALKNKRVRVTADPSVQADALPAGGKFPAKTIQVLDSGAAGDTFPLTGNRKYASLLCKYSDDAREPSPPSFFTTQLGNVYPGFDHYFNEASYGQASITGSTATSVWVTLPHTQAFYFPPGTSEDGSYLHQMAQDCVTAAESIINFTNFVGVNMMYNGQVDDCCAWGGSDVLTLEGVSRVVSVTWMPYWGYVSPGSTFGWRHHGVLGHELSHSFSSPHSDDPSGYQYGNYWDVVSKPAGVCAVADATYGCLSQHQVADNKFAMGFIPAARIATIAAGGVTATYNIERMAQPPNAGGTYQALKITTGDAHKYYTVESRLRTGYDQNLPGDGVLIHEVIDNRPHYPAPTFDHPGDPALLLRPDGVTSPFAGAGLGGLAAKWSPGDAYINNGDNLKITIVAFDAVTGTAQVKVEPSSAPGEFSFGQASYTVTEGGPLVNIPVTRSAPFTAPGSVTWTTSDGAAIAGTDFGTLGNATQKTGTLNWAAGVGGTQNITVGTAASMIPVFNDGVAESDEDFNITLSNPSGSVLGAQSTTNVTVKDGAVISFASSTSSVNEVGPNIAVNVTRSGGTTLTHTVNFSTIAGTATVSADFVSTSGTVTFNPGETTKSIAVGPTVVAAPYVRVMDDALIEGPETFTIRLATPNNGAILQGTTDNVVTIVSDENGVAMGSATAQVSESGGSLSLNAVRTGGSGAVDVNFSFGGGTAINGVHYTGTNGSLHWNDGETGTKSILINITDDAAVNANRTFVVTLSNASGATLTTPSATTVTIVDDDNAVQFTSGTQNVSEATPNVVIPVSRVGAVANPAQVHWSTSDNSAFAGTDFGTLGDTTQRSGTLNWAGGDAAVKNITIPILNNAILNGTRTFTVTLDTPVATVLGATNPIVVTIVDEDRGLQFASASYVITEGGTATITVKRVGPPATAISATWATVNGSAVSGTDFGVLGSTPARTGTLSWLANDSADKTFTIASLQNALAGQPDRTFTVTLTPSAGVLLGSPGTTSVVIKDDDVPPESKAQFAVSKVVVMENVGNVVLTLHRVDTGGGFARPVSVKYSTVAGSALATSDFVAVTNGTVNWGAGDSADKTVSIAIVNDAVAEPTETFKVTLSAPSAGFGILAPSEVDVTILDDDEVFPHSGAIPAGFSQTGSATKGWHVSSDPGAFEGALSLKSDEIDDNETAGIDMTGTFAAGNVSFRVKVSTEADFDVLQFYIDGVQMQQWSGTAQTGWQLSSTFPVTAGLHTLRWVYVKDGSVAAGMDAVYLDGLVTPAFTP